MSNLSQDAIDALLNQSAAASAASADASAVHEDDTDKYITAEEKDLLGEIGNICMGTSSTTMYTLLGQRVNITTPRVNVYTTKEVMSVYQTPFVVVEVEYVQGMEGKNLLILKEYDTAVITDLLMGGEGKIDEENVELNEIHLSAISEVMNQMIGSAATSLAKMLRSAVNISTPKATWVERDGDVTPFLGDPEPIIKIAFDMEIENVLNSEIMQLMSLSTGKKLCKTIFEAMEAEAAAPAPAPALTPTPAPAPAPASAPAPAPAQKVDARAVSSASQATAPATAVSPVHTIDVTPVSYQSFDDRPLPPAQTAGSIDLISDIPLQVSVELGRTQKNISDILAYGAGSVIVLDKLAGDLVEIVVNGKLIAKGEVVVIDENYGVRITDVISSGGSIT